MRPWLPVALLLLSTHLLACGENEPPTLLLLDAGDDWAPWPPQPGSAGMKLLWTIEGQAPTAETCAAIDLAHVRLHLVHPIADFETWTAPDLIAACEQGQILRQADQGLAAGHYRFLVELLHENGEPFQHQPAGEATLVAGAVTVIGAVNVTQATTVDGGG
jgi:hypothetical protein